MATATRNKIDTRDAASVSSRMPPQDLDAEMSLLGSMMLDRDAVGIVLPIIGREDGAWLYRPDHRALFEVLVDVYDAGEPIDLVVLTNELRRRNLLDQVGGVPYVVRLAESVPSAVNAEYYARIVRDKGILRDLIRCAGLIGDAAFADTEATSEILDRAERMLFEVTERRISGTPTALRETLEKVFAQIELREGRYLSGLATGFTELDDCTSGLQRGDFIVVAGRPSMGKSAWGLNVAEHMAANDNKAVAFFSLEMSKEQVAQRILCSRGRIDAHKLRRGMLNDGEIRRLGDLCGQLEGVPLYVDETVGMTALELRAKCRRLKKTHNIEAVFVDYLQLMRAPGAESRQVEISGISGQLKALGRELNVPVVAMAQLNRASEGREGNRPRMSDLRESGAIEQDADVVLLIHREEYFKPEDESVKGIAEVIVAKQRNGPTGTVKLNFNKRLTRFDNLALVAEPSSPRSYDDAPF